tara:strand:+ start:2560 stop:2958 length:399 start_codon:yes stop_codon:yes gene_type:complete
MENYKIYIDTDKPSVKIKFSISYLKPSESWNWATSETRETGYRVTGVPVERWADGKGESFTAFSGFGATLLPCKRRSQKRYEQAIDILQERLLDYVRYFEKKGYHICRDAINTLIEEKEHRDYKKHLNATGI